MRKASDAHVEILTADKKLRIIHLREALNTLLNGESRVALLMLRDIINASIGFKQLAAKVGKSDKNLMGMLTENSNPTLESFLSIIKAIMEYEGIVPSTSLKKKVG